MGRRVRPVDPTQHDPTAPSTVAGSAPVVGWGLALWGGAQIAGAVLDRNPLASATLQAVMAEWCAGRVGIAWSDPLAPAPAAAAIAGRAGRGALLGGAAAVLVVGSALATGDASLAPAPALGGSVELLAVGLFASALAAVRDELLLRGFVLRATRGLLPTWVCLVVCGAAAAAARFGVEGGSLVALAAEALRGIALGALWTRDRGAWMAFGANASWMWTLGSLTHGGLLDVRFVVAPDATPAALGVLTIVTLAACASFRRRRA